MANHSNGATVFAGRGTPETHITLVCAQDGLGLSVDSETAHEGLLIRSWLGVGAAYRGVEPRSVRHKFGLEPSIRSSTGLTPAVPFLSRHSRPPKYHAAATARP